MIRRPPSSPLFPYTPLFRPPPPPPPPGPPPPPPPRPAPVMAPLPPAPEPPLRDAPAHPPTVMEAPPEDPPTADTAPIDDDPSVDADPPPPPASGGLSSDDEIARALAEGLDAPTAAVPEALDVDTPPPPPRRSLVAGWTQGPEAVPPGATGTRLARHLAYEVIVTAVTFTVASILLFTSFNGEMRDVYVKGRQLLGGYPAPVSGEVSLVTIGTEALYLWDPSDPEPAVTPRGLLAEVVRLLDQAGARVIVLDFLLETPAPGDEALAGAAAAHGRVVAAERYVLTDPARGTRFAPGPAATLGDAVASGTANLAEEALWTTSEGRLVRALRLVEPVDRARLDQAWPASVGGQQAEGELTPHMTLLAAWRHRHPDAPADALFAALGEGCTGGPLRCSTDLAALGLPPGPALEGRFPINLRGPEGQDGLPTLRAAPLLRLAGQPALLRQAGVEAETPIPDWLREHVEDRLVVVGRVDATSADRFATPFSFPLPTRADMDGARLQAQAIDTLLSGRHVQHSPWWAELLLAGGLLAGVVLTARRLREDVHTLVVLATAGVLVAVGTGLFLFTDGFVLDLGLPLTAILLGLVGVRVRGWAAE